MIKIIYIFTFFTFLCFICDAGYAMDTFSEVSYEQIKPKEKINSYKKNINLKKVFTDEREFQNFSMSIFGTLQFENSIDLFNAIEKSTKGTVLSGLVVRNSFIVEFLYQLLKKPKSLSRFLTLFIQLDKLIMFTFVMILSFFISHLLGEFRFKFAVLSKKRVNYFICRFLIINSFRVIFTFTIFQENMAPLSEVYFIALENAEHIHPLFYIFSSFLSLV